MSLTKPTRPPLTNPVAGQYLYTSSQGAVGTSATLGNNTLRLTPWVVEATLKIDRIGAEITVVGDAGSKLRLGIHVDTGACAPGAVLLDAGQIAGDSATVQEITLGSTLVIAPGLYWIGGAVQAAATTQPTVRVNSGYHPPVPIPAGSSLPTAGGTLTAVSMGSVSGALPSFVGSGVAASAPRVFVRTA